MKMDILYILNSVLLGVGLAMDAFSVSVANAVAEPDMPEKKRWTVAGVYAGFQFAMPMLGWLGVHTIAKVFTGIVCYLPWIAFVLLCFIGGKMVLEAAILRKQEDGEKSVTDRGKLLTPWMLILQGIATSIDALSVGFTIASYTWEAALVTALIVAAVTFGLCMLGLRLGSELGVRVSDRAGLFGGLILIFIGIEILVRSFFP